MENVGLIDILEAVDADDPAGPMALLHVRDDGPGIPEHLREKVFQPFFTTKEEGTGLGLSIVARIVHEHGGRIRIAPAKGMGTTFIIALPIKE